MGLLLGLRYLMGWAQASHPSNREQPEWPPHPDRIFMAMAAAYFESEHETLELQALEWLEAQAPPSLYASRGLGRKVVTSYVPVNDSQMSRWKAGASPSADQLSAGLSLLPSSRNRQARQFPTVLLENEVVYLEWSETPAPQLEAALGRLCQKVTRVGHSSSLVQMWVEKVLPALENRRKLCPSENLGAFRLRTSSRGRMGLLSRAFEAGRRPPTAPYQGYSEAKPSGPNVLRPQSEFSPDFLILTARPKQGTFALPSTQLLTYHLRRKLLASCENPLPEWVSGHLPDGGKSEKAHLALVPLPHVGRDKADGHLLGIALVVPRDHVAEAGRVLGRALLNPSDHSPEAIRVTAGKAGDWELSLEDRDEVPQALQSETWTASRNASRVWGTVTPFVLDRHSKCRSFAAGAEAAVRAACQRIGLPEPESVQISKVSIFQGVPSVFEFPPILRKDGSVQQQTHCVVQFAEPVVGPVLIGSGRYRGYGFCRPLREKGGLS